MSDPYALLGVARDADPDAIKRAYRRLAKEFHPDRNLGDPEAEQRFKDITQAYRLLSDQKTRRDYDRGRIDGDGQRKTRSFNETAAHGQVFGRWMKGAETIFERVIDKVGLNGAHKTPSSRASSGQASTGRTSTFDEALKAARNGSDGAKGTNGAKGERAEHHRLEVDFMTAVQGGRQRIMTRNGRALDIDVPPGTVDHTILRLREQGPLRRGRDGEGDLLVSIRVQDHPYFTRRGRDLQVDLPISLREALFGAKVRTPTIEGAVRLTVPAGSNSGQILRLKGKGVIDRDGRRGDLYVRLMVTLPEEPDAAMAADLERLAGHDDYDPRAHLDLS